MSKALKNLEDIMKTTAEKASALDRELKDKEEIEEKIDLRLNESLRSRLIQEIAEIAEKITDELTKKEHEFKIIPFLHKDNEIMIRAYRTIIDNTSYFDFKIREDEKKYSSLVNEWERKIPDIRNCRPDEFWRRMEILRFAILNGGLDRILRQRGEES